MVASPDLVRAPPAAPPALGLAGPLTGPGCGLLVVGIAAAAGDQTEQPLPVADRALFEVASKAMGRPDRSAAVGAVGSRRSSRVRLVRSQLKPPRRPSAPAHALKIGPEQDAHAFVWSRRMTDLSRIASASMQRSVVGDRRAAVSAEPMTAGRGLRSGVSPRPIVIAISGADANALAHAAMTARFLAGQTRYGWSHPAVDGWRMEAAADRLDLLTTSADAQAPVTRADLGALERVTLAIERTQPNGFTDTLRCLGVVRVRLQAALGVERRSRPSLLAGS
jgi:hypothetical protein